MKRPIVLVPGAWMGAWVWRPVTACLRELGHDVAPLTLTGLDGETVDTSDIGLDTHVEEVVAVLEGEDLTEVVLVAHSYSGLICGQVADRLPGRVAHTVFVEAFLPHDGKGMLDAFPERVRSAELRLIEEHRGVWPVPERAEVSDGQGLTSEQAEWLTDRLVPHPGRTVSEPASLSRSLAELPATYIVCTKEHINGNLSEDVAAMRAWWQFRTIDTGHWPMISAAEDLAAIIAEIAGQGRDVRSSSPPLHAAPPENG